MNKVAAVLLSLSAAFAAPAFAQDGAITLRVDSGTVMASNGGEYVTANTGKPLMAGEKLMVNAGSSATAIYGDGCTVAFKDAGVYEVPAACTKAAWQNSGRGNVMNAGIIIGAGVIGAALLENMDKVEVGELSPGIRHL